MNNIKFIICMAVLIGVNGFYSSNLLAKNLRVNEALLGKERFALVGDYQRRIRNQEMALQNKIDKPLIKALDNLENDPKAAELALENLANKAVQADGIKGNVDIELYNSDSMTAEQLAEVEVLGKKYGKDEFGGFYDPESGKIYMNASKLNGSRSQISGILANELTHYVDHKKGRTFDQKRQDLSSEQEKNMRDQFAGYNGEESVSQEEKASFQDSIKTQDFSEGNVNASGVEFPQPVTTVHSRSVDKTRDLGRHLFIEVDPTGYDPTGKKRLISLDGPGLSGGEPNVNTTEGFKNDRDALKNKTVKDQQTIKVPKGMTEQEFDKRVIENAEKYDTKHPKNQYPPIGGAGQPGARNSNTYVDNVIEESGGEVKTFEKAKRQNSGEMTERIKQWFQKKVGKSEAEIESETRKDRGFK
ncbi:hypothetical protein HOH51_02900 [bacterium]|jgi:hypothetical protein|nr:hypothetical protein [bacterium]